MTYKTKNEISTDTIKEFIKSVRKKPIVHTVSFNNKEIKINVNPYINAKEYNGLISNIAHSCFSDDGEFYMPLKNFSTQLNILNTFTNINTDDIEVIYSFINFRPDIMQKITDDIINVYPNFYNDIDGTVEYLLNKKFHISQFRPIADGLKDFVENLKDKLSDLSTDEIKEIVGISHSN